MFFGIFEMRLGYLCYLGYSDYCPHLPVRKVSSQVRQEAPDEGRRSHRPKCCEYNNEDEDNSPNNLDNTSGCFLICSNCMGIYQVLYSVKNINDPIFLGWLVGFYGMSNHSVILCRIRFYLRTHIIYELTLFMNSHYFYEQLFTNSSSGLFNS